MTIHQHPTSAQIVALNMRFGKVGKGEPVERVKQHLWLHVRPDANQHVLAWEWWQKLQKPNLLAREYIKLRCQIDGVDYDRFMSKCRNRPMALFRRKLIREVKARYPAFSSPKLAQFFNREYTTVLHALGRTARAKRMGI